MHVSDLPPCHRCGGTPMFQWTRAATPGEAAALVAQLAVQQGRDLSETQAVALYGPLRMSVTGCADHGLDADGASGADLRALVHGADCGGHGACGCGDAA